MFWGSVAFHSVTPPCGHVPPWPCASDPDRRAPSFLPDVVFWSRMNGTTIIGLAIVLIALGFVLKRREGAAEIIPEEEIQRDLAAGATVVDVRTPGEFAAGHVDGAVNIPLNEVARRSDEFTAFTPPVLLCCRTGRRSGGAALILRRRGITEVKNAGAYQRVSSGAER